MVKSVFISIFVCLISAGIFSLAIIFTAPKKADTVPKQASTAPVKIKTDSQATVPHSIIGVWEFSSPKLGKAQITFDKEGTLKFKSNGMNILGKYAVDFADKTISLQLTGIVDGTVTFTGEMTDANTIAWKEIKGWDLGNLPLEWTRK